MNAIDYVQMIGVEEAHNNGINGKGVTVAIIEGAFNPNHPFYKDNLSKSTREETIVHQGSLTDYFFLPTTKCLRNDYLIAYENYIRHAALVTSTVKSIAPDSQLRVIGFNSNRKIDPMGESEEGLLYFALVKSLDMIAKDKECKVLNLSICLPLKEDSGILEEIRQAIINVAESGKIIVKSAGNESRYLGETVSTKILVDLAKDPRMKGRLLFVGGSTCSLEKEEGFTESFWDPSNRPGEAQEYYISAPASPIFGASSNSGWQINSGTSFAAPQVAGSLALLMEAAPGLEPEQYINLLTQSARKKSYMGNAELDRNLYGHGIVNVKNALQLAEEKGWVKS